MVDFSKTKPSENFEDTTDDTPTQHFLNNLMMKLNPVIAVRKIRSDLIDRGIIEIPGSAEMAGKASARVWLEQEKQRQAEAPIDIPTGGLSPEEMTAILETIKRRQIRDRKK